MRHHDHSFPPAFQVRQQLRVKDPAEGGILVGRPLVQYVDGPVFQVSRQQGQPPPLPLRKRRSRQRAALDPHFVRELQRRQVLPRLSIHLAPAQSKQQDEQIEI